MMQEPVWFPHGACVDVIYRTADVKIGLLTKFICEVAAALARSNSLAVAVRRAARQHPEAAAAFNLENVDAEIATQFALNDSLTFPNEPLPETIRFQRQGVTASLQLDPILARDVRLLLSMCGGGRCNVDQIRDAVDEPVRTLFESLLEHGIVALGASPSSPLLARMRGPGVTRLQHSGLLYRGHDSGILVDPHLHSSYVPRRLSADFMRSQFEGLVDAIVISHSHHDHWHLPTLMSFPPDTIIIVPKTPRPTMMCPDFAATLRAFGFTHVVPLGWFDPPVRVGDLEVHALPFYGEQPLLKEQPRHPDLRNHGNTYVLRHESYTSWFLIDSGNDWLGRMAQLAHEVKRRFGRIDTLLSNLREFAVCNPTYITGGHYWLALTPDQLRRFASMSADVLTLGPDGVAEICEIVRAREFLPYSHWWDEIGQPPGDEELILIEQLRQQLRRLGASTRIVSWRIGDTHVPTG